ncbi:hypothetical protein ACFSLT_20690 [Novosphingobium resinovorum]
MGDGTGMMNAFSLMLAGVAAASSPTEESVPTGRQGQEKPPAIVPAGPDPVYPADFYKPFQPQTALDMLERTPGFLLSEGTSVRGFGNAAGNVLIDGQRPTVKEAASPKFCVASPHRVSSGWYCCVGPTLPRRRARRWSPT